MKTFPDFTKIAFDATPTGATVADWRNRFEADTGKPLEEFVQTTLEGIDRPAALYCG